MDELEISGRRYISSRRAGKEHGYHADYIGQLIRAKKVLGQKVGRAWYVDAESLATYLGTESAPREASESVGRIVTKTPDPVVIAKMAEEVVVEEVVEVVVEEEDAIEEEPEVAPVVEEVQPVVEIKKQTHTPTKVTQPITTPIYRTIKEEREARTGLRYIADEGPLLPQIKKSSVNITRGEYPAVTKSTSHELTSEPLVMVEQEVGEEVDTEPVVEERIIKINRPIPIRHLSKKNKSHASSMMRAGVVLILGAIVFVVAALASTHLLFTETVDDGQGASAGYSIK